MSILQIASLIFTNKSKYYFWITLDYFWGTCNYWGCKNRLLPKTKPPSIGNWTQVKLLQDCELFYIFLDLKLIYRGCGTKIRTTDDDLCEEWPSGEACACYTNLCNTATSTVTPASSPTSRTLLSITILVFNKSFFRY